MGFWTLFQVASMPIVEVLLLAGLGALMATESWGLLLSDTRRSLNKIVFMLFTPSLIFSSLAKKVTLDDIISWWFMPVNIGLTFLLGSILGYIVVKLLKPKAHLEGLIIAACSAGNMGNLPIIIIPAVCDEEGSPFGERGMCRSVALSYASFSMALGGFYIWTYTYQLVRASALKFKALEQAEDVTKAPNRGLEDDQEAALLKGEDDKHVAAAAIEGSCWNKLKEFVHQIVEELLAPPSLSAFVGLIFGAVGWLKNLIIGDDAPLRVIQSSIQLLGDGTIPCITLILGGNLTRGLQSSKIRPAIIVGVILVRYLFLPLIGIWIVKLAASLGFLPADPLYQYALMVQYTVPPAMNIGTMTQLFDVGQEECSIIFLWTYLVAALGLTVWSTVYMWILS